MSRSSATVSLNSVSTMTLNPTRLARVGTPSSFSHRSIQIAKVDLSGSYPGLGATNSTAGTSEPSGILRPFPRLDTKSPSSFTSGSSS